MGKILLQLLDDGEIGIEHVQGLLCEVTHILAGPEPNASDIWSTGAGNHLEQRGLIRTISSHDGPASSAADCEIEPFVNHARAVTLVQILENGHLFAGSRRNTKLELHHLAFLRQFDLLDLVQGLIRLCTCAALAACVLKRSMKRCSFASIDWANAAC